MKRHWEQLGYCGRCGLPFDEVGTVSYHRQTLPICRQCALATGVIVSHRLRNFIYGVGVLCTFVLGLAFCFFSWR